MATVIRTSVRDILSAVKARLVARLGLGDHLIKAVAREDIPSFPGDRYLLLILGDPVPEPGWQEGSGRVASVARRPLAAVIRTRNLKDTSDDYEQQLLSSDGILSLEEATFDALQLFLPQVINENALTVEPLHWTPSQRPVPVPPDPAWGQSVLWFSLLYMPILNQADQ